MTYCNAKVISVGRDACEIWKIKFVAANENEHAKKKKKGCLQYHQGSGLRVESHESIPTSFLSYDLF